MSTHASLAKQPHAGTGAPRRVPPPGAPGPGTRGPGRGRRTLARPRGAGLAAGAVLLVVLAAMVRAFVAVKINVATMADSAGNAADFVSRMVPLDFPPPGSCSG